MPDNRQHTFESLNAISIDVEEFLKRLMKLVDQISAACDHNSTSQLKYQLKVVNDSIQRLEDQNVTVPDALRKLKANLTSNLCHAEETERIRIKVSEQLYKALIRLGFNPQQLAPPVIQGATGKRKKKRGDDNGPELFYWNKPPGGDGS